MNNLYTLLLGWFRFSDAENCGDEVSEVVILKLDDVIKFRHAEDAEKYGEDAITCGRYTSYLVVETYEHPIRFTRRGGHAAR